MSHSINVLHITDNHLFDGSDVVKNGLNSSTSLAAVLDQALEQATPDLVVDTGDIAQDPSDTTYRRFQELVEARVACPTLCVPGNHDLDRYFERFNRASIEIGDWTFVGLDTHTDNELVGNVSTEELDRVTEELQGCENHVAVFGHHPLTVIGAKWIDAHRVVDGDVVAKRLGDFPNVRAYVCGHIHQEVHLKLDGLDFYATPSTCWQFAVNSEQFALDEKPPGWRWFEFQTDGGIRTQVYRLNDHLNQ